MIPPALLWLSSLLLRVVCAFARPSSMRCPPRWWFDGIRPSGEFTCLYTPVVESDAPGDELDARIYCDDDAAPRVTWNGERVECEPFERGQT